MRKLLAALVVAMSLLLSATAAVAEPYELDEAIGLAEGKFITELEPAIEAIYLESLPFERESSTQLGTVYSSDEITDCTGICSQIQPVVLDTVAYHALARVYADGTVLTNVYPEFDDDGSVHERGRQFRYNFELPKASAPATPEQPKSGSKDGAAPATTPVSTPDHAPEPETVDAAEPALPTPTKPSQSTVRSHVEQFADSQFMNIDDLPARDGQYYYQFTLHEYDRHAGKYLFEVRAYDTQERRLDEGGWEYTLSFSDAEVGPADTFSPLPHIEPEPATPEAVPGERGDPLNIQHKPDPPQERVSFWGPVMFLAVLLILAAVAILVWNHRQKETQQEQQEQQARDDADEAAAPTDTDNNTNHNTDHTTDTQPISAVALLDSDTSSGHDRRQAR